MFFLFPRRRSSPSSPGCLSRDLLTLARTENFSPRFSTLQAAFTGELVYGLGGQASVVLDLARGDIHDELGKLRGIARSFGALYGYIGHDGECGDLCERVKSGQFRKTPLPPSGVA